MNESGKKSDWKLLGHGKSTETIRKNMSGQWRIKWGENIQYKDFYEEELNESASKQLAGFVLYRDWNGQNGVDKQYWTTEAPPNDDYDSIDDTYIQVFPTVQEAESYIDDLLKSMYVHDSEMYQKTRAEFHTQPASECELPVNEPLFESFKSIAAAGLMAASSLTGVSNADAKPIVKSSMVSANASFTDYIKSVENGIRRGWDKNKGLWFPHKSFEGGSDTIAYGHKLKPGEDFSGGITEEEATELLKKDLEIAKKIVYQELKNVKLTPKQEEMFVDFVFNMGTLKKFPKFVGAVLKNDIDTMRKEYERSSAGKKLKGRNAAFYNRFLS
jgi:GH24 family phage-related lysozyme (muramidase)